jgi:hypothetical protein
MSHKVQEGRDGLQGGRRCARGSVHRRVSVCIGGSMTLLGIAGAVAPRKVMEPPMHTDGPSSVTVSWRAAGFRASSRSQQTSQSDRICGFNHDMPGPAVVWLRPTAARRVLCASSIICVKNTFCAILPTNDEGVAAPATQQMRKSSGPCPSLPLATLAGALAPMTRWCRWEKAPSATPPHQSRPCAGVTLADRCVFI